MDILLFENAKIVFFHETGKKITKFSRVGRIKNREQTPIIRSRSSVCLSLFPSIFVFIIPYAVMSLSCLHVVRIVYLCFVVHQNRCAGGKDWGTCNRHQQIGLNISLFHISADYFITVFFPFLTLMAFFPLLPSLVGRPSKSKEGVLTFGILAFIISTSVLSSQMMRSAFA